MTDLRIPAHIVTGFLGSGKTTFLKTWLREMKQEGKTPGVVMNEWGDLNIDREDFADEPLLEMLDGCICCTIQDDLKEDLSRFLNQTKERPDVLFIEATGIADPYEIVAAVSDIELIDRLKPESVIGVIDAKHFLSYLSLFQSSKEVRTTLKHQIQASSLVVLNKIDLIDEKTKEKVHKKIAAEKSVSVPVIEAEHGDISFAQVLATQRQSVNSDFPTTDELQSEHHHDHDHSFHVVSIDIDHKVSAAEITKWIKQLPAEVIRMKGVVQLEDGSFTRIQWAGEKIEYKQTELEKSRVILIGYHVSPELMRKSLLQGMNYS